MKDLEFKVYCWYPNCGDNVLIASFDCLDDAKEFAKNKTETYKKRYYSNRGTFILNNENVSVSEFEKN